MTALLYSIFPPEIVFSESGPTEALPQGMRGSSSLPETQERLVEITVDGVRLLHRSAAAMRVVRLLAQIGKLPGRTVQPGSRD